MAILTNALLGRLGAVVLGVMTAIVPRPDHRVRAQEALENDVKAAFLFNFTKFVDWPPGAFEDPASPIRVCVVADAAFVASVDRIILGETVRGRPLRRVVPEAGELRRCHVLYVGAAETGRAARLLAPLGSAPVLSVGESPQFLDEGGAIAFILVNDRVRFEVNLAAANRAGLTVSSKLLRVAREIHAKERRP